MMKCFLTEILQIGYTTIIGTMVSAGELIAISKVNGSQQPDVAFPQAAMALKAIVEYMIACKYMKT